MSTYACGVLRDNGKILLGKRSSHRRIYPGLWDVIGGKVEAGESVEQALVRELREELGIVPLGYEHAGVVQDTIAEAGGLLTYHMFLVRTWRGGPPAIRDHEHTEIRWFTPGEACALPDLAADAYRAVFRRIETMS